jgi:hypothetical protein
VRVSFEAVAELDNLPAWRGRSGAYEVWFLTCTDRVTGHGYWFRSALTAPTEGPAYGAVWFARFDRSDPTATFGIHRRFGMDAVSVSRDEFDVRVGGSTFRSGHLDGSLEGDGHRARWEVDFPIGGDTYRLLPDVAYRGGLAPTKPYSPNPSTSLTGRIEVDGSTFELSGAPAQQGHLVGKEHAQRWAWATCTDFDDDEATVQALTAQGRRGPLTTPYLTSIGLRWDGRWIRLAKISRRREFGLGIWRVNLGNRRYRLTGRFEAPVEALIRARYEDPNGTPRYCHNSEVSSSRLVLFERRAGGFEELAVLESRGTTHGEWAGLTPARSVARDHAEIEPADLGASP